MPLCSEWQRAQSLFALYRFTTAAWKPWFAVRRWLISAWQSRHFRPPPLPNLWQLAHCVTPEIDWWARESGPGEICARNGACTESRLTVRNAARQIFSRHRRAKMPLHCLGWADAGLSPVGLFHVSTKQRVKASFRRFILLLGNLFVETVTLQLKQFFFEHIENAAGGWHRA